MSAIFLADPVAKEHDPGRQHPERVERWDAAVQGVGVERVKILEPRQATEDELTLCHTPAYVKTARSDSLGGMRSLSTGDTDINTHSWLAAIRGAGVSLNAVDQVFGGKASRAFCVVRPPGHHATPTRGMGFCLFNNVAIAARYAQKRHGVERVLIADWDVHHGNGTQDIFYKDGSVFFFSTHQSPWYPGTGDEDETGEGPGAGKTMNCPFSAGAGRDDILGAFRERLAPAMKEFRPDLVLLSAGFDSRLGDPLGHFRLTDEDFTELTNLTLDLADRYAKGRLISVLEGGYNLTGLKLSVAAHADTLARA